MPESAPAADWSWQDDPDVVSWDHRQGPDLGDLRDLLARHGLSVAEVDTGTDDVAIRISSTPVEVMEGALCRHEPGQPLAEPRRPGAAPARAAGENRTGNRPNLAAAGRTPPDRHQDTPEGAGADSGPIPSRTAAAVRASRDPGPDHRAGGATRPGGRPCGRPSTPAPSPAYAATCQQEPTTAEETTMTDQTTLHALAEECEAHAQAWDERDDPDGHAAAWDALHTLLTAAGASVEHLARVRPDLAPVAVDDIVTAVRRLAAHLTRPAGGEQDV